MSISGITNTETEVEFEPTEPDIRRPLESQTVKDGGTARLECLISGDPKPNVTWFKEATIIPPSDDFMQFHDDDNMVSLVIKEVFPEDAGRYMVVAKNPSGTASCSAELVVEEGNERAIDKCYLKCMNLCPKLIYLFQA